MVKHTQAIRRQFVNELFGCVWPFCEMVLNTFLRFERPLYHLLSSICYREFDFICMEKINNKIFFEDL